MCTVLCWVDSYECSVRHPKRVHMMKLRLSQQFTQLNLNRNRYDFDSYSTFDCLNSRIYCFSLILFITGYCYEKIVWYWVLMGFTELLTSSLANWGLFNWLLKVVGVISLKFQEENLIVSISSYGFHRSLFVWLLHSSPWVTLEIRLVIIRNV